MHAGVLFGTWHRTDIGASACRAVKYAMSQGVTIVASAGNDDVDLNHLPKTDDSSPNNGKTYVRRINQVRHRRGREGGFARPGQGCRSCYTGSACLTRQGTGHPRIGSVALPRFLRSGVKTSGIGGKEDRAERLSSTAWEGRHSFCEYLWYLVPCVLIPPPLASASCSWGTVFRSP